MTTKTFKVVMLPSKERVTKIGLNPSDVRGNPRLYYFKDGVAGSESQYLYILSDEEIKDGDWCINSQMNLFQASKGFCSETLKLTNSKKVIATTDKSLMIDI